MGAYALQQNVWNVSRCSPEVILAEYNEWNEITKIGSVKKMLEDQGYVAITPVGEDILFIEKDSVEKFQKIRTANIQLLSERKVRLEFFNTTIGRITKYMPPKHSLGSMSYDIFTSSVYLHFAVKGNNLDLCYLQKYSDKIALPEHIGRPLLIYNYDPRNSSIILKGDYKI